MKPLLSSLFVGSLVLLYTSTPIPAIAEDPVPNKATVTIVNAERNLLSQEIWGKWTLDKEFTKYICDDEREELTAFNVEKDPEAADRIVKAIADFIDSGKERRHDGITREFLNASKTVYCAGSITIEKDGKSSKLDLALVGMQGTPFLVVGAGSKLETANVSFVRDPDGDHDLLFVGGDRPTEHFLCFKRAAKEEDKDK